MSDARNDLRLEETRQGLVVLQLVDIGEDAARYSCARLTTQLDFGREFRVGLSVLVDDNVVYVLGRCHHFL